MKIDKRHPLSKRFFRMMYPDFYRGSVSSNRYHKMVNKSVDAANECLEMLKFYHVFISTRKGRIFDDDLLKEFFDLAFFTKLLQ